MRRWWWLLFGSFLGLLAACPTGVEIPGAEKMGVFDFHAFLKQNGEELVPPTFNECLLDEVPLAFDFEAIMSRDPGTPRAWITLGRVSNEALFDGQVIASYAKAPRTLDECTCPGSAVYIDERITVALLSKSQRDALGRNDCPRNPLDGGVPKPDGGVILPDSTPNGFDALLACGELVNTLTSDPACTCNLPDGGQFRLERCSTGYKLHGARR